jgi:transposase-like protein
VLALIDRDSGTARTMVVDAATAATIMPIIRANVAKEAVIMTDESAIYRSVSHHFAAHGTTNHSAGQYVDYELPGVHTDTIEGYFSISKRGMNGVYQYRGEQHLHRYLAEFEFRYNHHIANGVDDHARSQRALRGIAGKRITYRRPHVAQGQNANNRPLGVTAKVLL